MSPKSRISPPSECSCRSSWAFVFPTTFPLALQRASNPAAARLFFFPFRLSLASCDLANSFIFFRDTGFFSLLFFPKRQPLPSPGPGLFPLLFSGHFLAFPQWFCPCFTRPSSLFEKLRCFHNPQNDCSFSCVLSYACGGTAFGLAFVPYVFFHFRVTIAGSYRSRGSESIFFFVDGFFFICWALLV